MTGRAVKALIAIVLGIGVCCVGGLMGLSGAASACTPTMNSSTASSASAPPGTSTATTEPPNPTGYDSEQLTNAATIAAVGTVRGVPTRGLVIAVATAIQESSLRNLDDLGDNNDHDSLGLFQQRPSQGWGTPEQIRDPVHASNKFYDKLLAVPNLERLPLTEASQAVQRSAYPDAYATWEVDAAALVGAVSSGNSSAVPEDLEHCLSICPPILSNAPVDLHIPSGSFGLACSDITPGSAEPAPRNPDGSWPDEGCIIHPDPTTSNGCVTPRLLHLVQQADAAGFPKPGCYRVDDHGEHPKGRACDWMMTSGGEASGAQKARGDAMAAWAVANADRLGIMYVIWFHMIWTPDEGWHAYNNPWGGDDPSGWHTNHVHVSVQ